MRSASTNGELLAKLLKLCFLCGAKVSSCRHSSLPSFALRQTTARLSAPVSAVTMILSFHSTGEDHPFPSSAFHAVFEPSTVEGRFFASLTPLPLGPRKRAHSSAPRQVEAIKVSEMERKADVLRCMGDQ